MAEANIIAALPRAQGGKGPARAARREGRVPAVIYGDKKSPELISLELRGLLREYLKGGFLSTIYEVEIDGRKERVLPKDVQLHPVTDVPLHVDFQRVSPSSRIVIGIPVTFVGHADSPGLKRGGVLNIVRHQVEVRCPPDAVPEHFEVNLAGLEINASVHISAVTLPPNVVPTIVGRDFTIATIAPSAGARGGEADAKATAAAGGKGKAAPAKGKK
ncbi:50S ribosomal protein L25/general stress protein Ctc [Zavarzinia sp. CC-PAN008]|uniref:50S ribosomal protein L25/general stress protein Ctc n=1 Tax=Zavarzinia sp. CC-PAN008 TaxID=3243332 RepID=UPI003F7461E4